MRKKVLILTLCFTIILSTINFKKSYAIDPVITPTMIATVATMAVASGIIMTSADDIIDIGYMFYEHHKENWEVVSKALEVGVTIGANKLVTVGSEALGYIQGAFDGIFGKADTGSGSYPYDNIAFAHGVPYGGSFDGTEDMQMYLQAIGIQKKIEGARDFKLGNVDVKVNTEYSSNILYDFYLGGEYLTSSYLFKNTTYSFATAYVNNTLYLGYGQNPYGVNTFSIGLTASSVVDMPYSPGSYDWDNVGSNTNEDGSVGVYVPGNLGDLVGVPGGGTIGGNPSYDLPTDGNISIPNVSNPSLPNVGGATGTIPGTGVGTACPECGLVGTHSPTCSLGGTTDPPVPPPVLPPLPSFGDGINLEPLYASNITTKFPFSLPWDIGRLLDKFNSEPKAPKFTVPIVSEELEIDLTQFDTWATIIRFFVLLGFILSLIHISTQLKG